MNIDAVKHFAENALQRFLRFSFLCFLFIFFHFFLSWFRFLLSLLMLMSFFFWFLRISPIEEAELLRQMPSLRSRRGNELDVFRHWCHDVDYLVLFQLMMVWYLFHWWWCIAIAQVDAAFQADYFFSIISDWLRPFSMRLFLRYFDDYAFSFIDTITFPIDLSSIFCSRKIEAFR